MSILLNFVIMLMATALVVASVYVIVKIRASSTYKANQDDTNCKRALVAAILTLFIAAATASLSLVVLVISIVSLSKTSKLSPSYDPKGEASDATGETDEESKMMF